MCKIQMLEPIIENIPPGLKERNQWVVWKKRRMIIEGATKNKFQKVPFNARSRKNAKTNNPNTWCDFETACEVYSNNGYDGIGFVFTKSDPYLGIDLDNCRDSKTGKIEPWVNEIIKVLDTYFEVSPSGTGLRGFIKATLPIGASCKEGDIELFLGRSFNTVTGHHLHFTPLSINDRQNEIESIYAKVFKPKKVRKRRRSITPAKDDMEKILEKAFKSKNGKEISALYNRDISGYDSQSEADLALCYHLAFWFDHDPLRIDEAFRASMLYRPKWDEIHYSDGKTYGQGTIQKALESDTTTYKPSSKYTTSENTPLTVISASDLLQREFPRDPLVIGHGILPEQGGLILAGESGMGKSLLLLDWAIHLALGRHLLNGKLTVLKPRRVMILQSENLLFMMQKHLKKMIKGLEITDPLNINFSAPFKYDINNENCVSQMIDVIGENEADVIIADPLSSFHQASENDNVLMRSVLDQFTHISHITGTAVLISHHFGKPQSGRSEAYRLRGASSIKDWADTLITIEPRSHQHKNLRLIRFLKVRYGVEPKPILLERDKTSLLHKLSQEEDLIVSPNELAEFLKDKFNGRVEMKKTFTEAAAKKFKCTERTVLNVLKMAVKRKLISEKRSGRQVSLNSPRT